MESLSAVAVEEELSDKAIVDQCPRFGLLLDVSRQIRLRDASVRLFAAASAQLQPDEAKKYTSTALGRLRQAVVKASVLDQDVQAMADACHGASVLTAALSVSDGGDFFATPPAAEFGRRLIDDVAFMLSALCLEGPAALRPALFPCIALLVSGRGHMLSLHPSLVESLRTGLSSASRAVRIRAIETVTSIVTGPPGEHGTNAVTRQVVALQPELLGFLAAEVPPTVTRPALAALQVLADSATLSPRTALPRVLAECLAGAPCNGAAAEALLLRLLGADPTALSECLLPGLHKAVDLLARRDVGPAELLRSLGDKASSIATVPAAIRCVLFSEELRRPCVSKLLEEVAGLHGVEAGASCSSVPLLGALLFCFSRGLAAEIGSGMTAGMLRTLDTRSATVWQDGVSEELPLGTCVARLVIAALTQCASSDESATSGSLTISGLATALEELDVEEVLVPGSRAKLLEPWRPKLIDSGSAVAGGGVPVVATIDTENADALTPVQDAPPVNMQTETPRARSSSQASSAVAGAPGALQIPSYAEYDASRDVWRCRLCALAGGKNGYAKGICMDATLVPMRMRIHARAAIHKKAEAEAEAEAREQRAEGEASVQGCAESATRPESATTVSDAPDTDVSSLGGLHATASIADVTAMSICTPPMRAVNEQMSGCMPDITESIKLPRAASSTGDKQRELKRRRLCDQTSSHDDLGSCKHEAATSSPATSAIPATQPPRKGFSGGLSWLSCVADFAVAPKVVAKEAAAASEPWQKLAHLCGLSKRPSLGGA